MTVVLTLPIRYRFIADCRKMHNLLTLVDQLDFICKRKRKSISVTKKKKKSKKKSLVWFRASYLYGKIIHSGKYSCIVADVWVSRWVGLFADRLLNIYHLSIEFF